MRLDPDIELVIDNSIVRAAADGHFVQIGRAWLDAAQRAATDAHAAGDMALFRAWERWAIWLGTVLLTHAPAEPPAPAIDADTLAFFDAADSVPPTDRIPVGDG